MKFGLPLSPQHFHRRFRSKQHVSRSPIEDESHVSEWLAGRLRANQTLQSL